MRVTLRSWVNPIWNNEISQCKVLIINSKTLVIKFIYIYGFPITCKELRKKVVARLQTLNCGLQFNYNLQQKVLFFISKNFNESIF